MRKVLALVALAWACDGNTLGNGNTNNPDGGVDPDGEITPDAPPSVEGMWRDTYHTTFGPLTTASCTSAPVAVTVDQTTAVVTPYPGTCKTDGSFKIDAPGNIGTYFLRVQGVLYESNKRAGIDLSTDRLGRNDVNSITGVTLSLNVSGLQSWTNGDNLVAFGANIGFRQNLLYTSGGPSAGVSSFTGTSNWNGYKIDSSKSDSLQLYQLGKHTTAGSLDYTALDRILTAPSFTMSNNTAHSVTGAFGGALSSSVNLNLDVASFNQFASAVAPSHTAKTITGSAYAAVSTEAIESPSLIAFAQNSDGVTAMNFGQLFYQDPFPASWSRLVKVQVGFNVPYSYSAATGTMTALVFRVLPKATATAGLIAATLGPPTDVKFDGANAKTATLITTVPQVTWSAPTVGTATDYEVQVYEVKTVSTSLTFTSVLRLVTKQTSLRLPSGYLLGQRQYVVSVRARNREGVDVYATPLRLGPSWSSAETLSSMVTTN